MYLTDYFFSDFDGTISKFDVIHKFIETFAKGDTKKAEKLWMEGKITTKECIEIQFICYITLLELSSPETKLYSQ